MRAQGVSAQPGAPGAERFVLTGLVVWSGNEGVAWLQEPDLTRNEIVALRIGQSVGPWKLTRFLDNGVELDGPVGKVLVPLQNVGAGGTAVAAGAPAGAAPAAAPSAAVSPLPGFAGGPVPNDSGLSEAFNRALAARGQQQAENAPNQPREREAGPAGGQAVRGPSTPSAASVSELRGWDESE